MRANWYRIASEGYRTALQMLLIARQDAGVSRKMHGLRATLYPFDRGSTDRSPPARDAAPETEEPDPRQVLTPRELETLKLIAQGESTKQAAWTLGITFKTAACHRYRIMSKLGIHDTASLVRYAIRKGLVGA